MIRGVRIRLSRDVNDDDGHDDGRAGGVEEQATLRRKWLCVVEIMRRTRLTGCDREQGARQYSVSTAKVRLGENERCGLWSEHQTVRGRVGVRECVLSAAVWCGWPR
jgi:hypothetical protein